LFLCSAASAQQRDANYDEAKVPKYTLPDPLVLQNGQPVRDARTWTRGRRPEILKLFEAEIYGRSPAAPKRLPSELFSVDKNALGGKAVRKQVTIYFSAKKDGPKMDMLIYLPAGAKKPMPIFLGLNFTGNHSVNADPGIRLGDVWDREKVKQHGTEASRGSAASRWEVEKLLARGYGLATIYYGDIEPDFDGGRQYGIRALFQDPSLTWGAIGAWAWGLSRAVDYIQTDKDIDAKRIALTGHSRLGKTALWAGAQDTRFALVISNCSGEGGAALSRRKLGEQPKHLNDRHPYWFCTNYKKYSDHEDDLPVDHHELIALIAPRPVYIAAAERDLWADPKGMFLAGVAASPVYHLFGKQGIETDQMPPLNHPVGDTVAFYIRAGKHDINAYDWDQHLDFADRQLR
jgi:hypothetical protein